MELVSIYILTILRKEASETSLIRQLTHREKQANGRAHLHGRMREIGCIRARACARSRLSTIHRDHAQWTQPIITIIKSIHNVCNNNNNKLK